MKIEAAVKLVFTLGHALSSVLDLHYLFEPSTAWGVGEGRGPLLPFCRWDAEALMGEVVYPKLCSYSVHGERIDPRPTGFQS